MNFEKIKILHIIASHGIGGAESVLLTLLRKIDRKRFDVVLGVFIDKRQRINPFWEQAVKLNLPLEPIRLAKAYDLLQIVDLFKIIQKYRPHVIHSHGYKTNFLGFLVGKLFGIRTVATVHGLYSDRLRAELFVRASFVLLRHFDVIITVSDKIGQLLENMKVHPRKMITIRNVPNINVERSSKTEVSFREEISLPPDSKIIGFVGRLEPIKGCCQFIKAAFQVARKNSNCSFVIIGEGSERTLLEGSVNARSLGNRIHFIGFREDVQDIFRALDLFVLPSLNEGIPLALLEAMYHGTPVIATSVGGVPEIIQDGVNGILVPPNDSNALAAAIIESLRDPDMTTRRVVEAKRTINREFNVGRWTRKIERVYINVVRSYSEENEVSAR